WMIDLKYVHFMFPFLMKIILDFIPKFSYSSRTPLVEGRFMRRLEVERIGDVRRATAARVGAGEAAVRASSNARPTGVHAPGREPRGSGLVWRRRAVPRPHDPGRRGGTARLATTSRLRGAR